MRIIYIADDGTQFYDEYDCKDYEWRLKHSHLKEIHAFDKDGAELNDIVSEDTYNLADKIVVESIEALSDLKDLADYTGYCAYYSIDKIGEWKFDTHTERFEFLEEGT